MTCQRIKPRAWFLFFIQFFVKCEFFFGRLLQSLCFLSPYFSSPPLISFFLQYFLFFLFPSPSSLLCFFNFSFTSLWIFLPPTYPFSHFLLLLLLYLLNSSLDFAISSSFWLYFQFGFILLILHSFPVFFFFFFILFFQTNLFLYYYFFISLFPVCSLSHFLTFILSFLTPLLYLSHAIVLFLFSSLFSVFFSSSSSYFFYILLFPFTLFSSSSSFVLFSCSFFFFSPFLSSFSSFVPS